MNFLFKILIMSKMIHFLTTLSIKPRNAVFLPTIKYLNIAGGSAESEEEEAGVTAAGIESSDVTSEALERLARAGQWERCLAQAGPRARYYALRYAIYLFKAHSVCVLSVSLLRRSRAYAVATPTP